MYDGDGNRVKTFSTAGTLYWRDTSGRILSETNLTGGLKSDDVFFNGQRIARFDPKTLVVHYYLSNHVGSHVLVTNATGSCEQDIEYNPYGGQGKQYCTTCAPQKNLTPVHNCTNLSAKCPSSENDLAAVESLGGEQALPAPPSADIAKALREHTRRLGEPGDDWRQYREITGEVDLKLTLTTR